MNYLTDNPWPLLMILGTVAIVGLLSGSATGRKLTIISLVLAVGVFLLEKYLISDEEVVENEVQQMLQHFKSRDLTSITGQISAGSPQLAKIAGDGLELVDLSPSFDLRSVEVTIDEATQTATAMIRANGDVTLRKHGGTQHRVPNYWRTVWVTENGQWKLSKAMRLNPVNGTEMGYFAAQ